MSAETIRERYAVAPLQPHHDRGGFRCGVESLDRYLQQQASQDVKRRVASVFVAEHRPSAVIHGFYALSMSAVGLDLLPADVARKMPRYPTVPAVRLGRLAVHEDARGVGLGAYLLADSMARSLRSEIAWSAFLVDAKDAVARSFYARFGFQSLLDDVNHLVLRRNAIEPLFAAS